MGIFQISILRNYLKNLDQNKVNQAWEIFKAHFHDPDIQENIRNSNEEQYQEGFLEDLFVKVFGYVKNPTPDYNLTTELKNIRGAKKTDGAILKNGKALAIIELKGTETTDLGKVEHQAFGYKNNQPECKYVIISNFEKLRFYVQNAVNFEEFNLFNLQKHEFEILWLCLAAKNLLRDVALKIKEQSVSEDAKITQKLYGHYTQFRGEMFDSLTQRNPQYDKLTLFKKTQKLLDRFLFLYFAEDRGLLPPNSVRKILRDWTDLQEKYDVDIPLYERFKQYFGYLNTGSKEEIYPYNGGLFEPDEVLDFLKIDDGILYKHAYQLSQYDYESEVSVNVLGHIFEHSLNEIEEIQAQLQGIEIEKNQSKRKKDGVFYTPEYITKYMVENTIGKLCEAKKEELEIIEEEYEKERKGRKKSILKTLQDKLKNYRNWLLELTICDPACGSGAFLNQALTFLRAEHQYIDELEAKLLGNLLVLSDLDNTILENNLFGVDINEESVEIAQLSLWLHTAKQGRKLTTLSNNIKCGNSLIDDPAVAGEKAFDWAKEFPKIFENGGFHVIIGNPPYVQLQKMNKDITQQLHTYYVYHAMGDIYALFYEKGVQILTKNGLLSLITSGKWMRAGYGKNLRQFLAKNLSEIELVEFAGYQIFEDATVDTNILTGKKLKNTGQNFGAKISKNFEISTDLSVYFEKNKIALGTLSEKMWENISLEKRNLKRKIEKKGIPLKDWEVNIYRGVLTGFNEAFVLDKQTKEQLIKEDIKSAELIKPLLRGRDIQRYQAQFADFYLICTFPSLNIDINDFSAIKKYLELFGNRLNQSGEKGSRKKTQHKWFETQDSIGYWQELAKEKIAWKRIGSQLRFSYSSNGYAYLDSTCILTGLGVKYLLTVLNSKLCGWMLNEIGQRTGVGDLIISVQSLEPLPIPKISGKNQQPFIEKADKMLALNADFQKGHSKFLKLLQAQFALEKVSKKLQNWHELDFGNFLKELTKIKITLSLSDKSEWMEFFELEKSKVRAICAEIEKTDAEIDQMVYQLYGLTEEEIRIVEDAVS